MENSKIILWGVVLLVIVGALFYLNNPSVSDTSSEIANSVVEKTAESSGKILAGDLSKYLEFNKAEYEMALSENKIILLYFYASWCPTCKAEQPETIMAFDEINNPNIIGFRVNYKDSATDDYEESLAQKFGVPYQHTKVIIQNGEQVLKSLDSWNKNRYLEELNNLS